MYTCASATVPHNPLLPGELLFKGFPFICVQSRLLDQLLCQLLRQQAQGTVLFQHFLDKLFLLIWTAAKIEPYILRGNHQRTFSRG